MHCQKLCRQVLPKHCSDIVVVAQCATLHRCGAMCSLTLLWRNMQPYILVAQCAARVAQLELKMQQLERQRADVDVLVSHLRQELEDLG